MLYHLTLPYPLTFPWQPLVGTSKGWQKLSDTLEGSRDLPGCQQSPAKALGCSGGKQGPFTGLTKPGKSPGALWKAAGPLAGFCKAWLKLWGALERSRTLCRPKQNPAKALGHFGGKKGPLWALAKAVR